MTKNSDNADKRTVTVLSRDGEQTGFTYPRRAAGLVKKGRARYVNDNTIRLENNVSDVTKFTEDIKMDNNINSFYAFKTPDQQNNQDNRDNREQPVQSAPREQSAQSAQPAQPVNRLNFTAREWSFNSDCKKNVGNRSFMQGPDGIITEAFMIGDWGWNWTEIVTKSLILPKHTLHTFTFWLNGGENDQNDEVCRLEIIFNNDYENRYTYNLNRNFIKPLKKCRGWELYEIPFITADNEYTQLKFVAQRAYMTVLNAKAASEYADLPEILDEFEDERPQRHNIIFADGFPTNTWYSTKNLREQRAKKQLSGQDWESKYSKAAANPAPNSEPVGAAQGALGTLSSIRAEIHNTLQGLISDNIAGKLNELRDEILSEVRKTLNETDIGDTDPDDIADEIMSRFEDEISDLTDSITDKLDEMSDALDEAVDDINDSLQELNDD